MTDVNEATRSEVGSGPMRTLEAGTASFPDIALLTMMSNLAGRLGRSIGPSTPNAKARGVLGVAAGVAIIVWPDESLSSAVVLFGTYGILDGILSLLGLFVGRDRYWQRAAQALASLAIGVFALTQPDTSRTAVICLLAVWVVVMGALRLKAAMDFTGDKVSARWFAATFSVLAIVGGSMVLVAPDGSALSVMLNVAAFAIINGVALIAFDARAARARTA